MILPVSCCINEEDSHLSYIKKIFLVFDCGLVQSGCKSYGCYHANISTEERAILRT